ncbi:MFS transporter, partial [Leucobacter soli]
MAGSTKGVLLRFAPMIYGPTVLFAIGEGAVVPLIPILAARLGGDLAVAGLVASALVVGQLCGNLPAGWLVARFGERLTMAGAGGLALLGVLGLILAPSLGLLAAAVFVIGLCAAAFGLARHAFMTTRVPLSFRARALALLGGSFRFGMFIGPFLAALLLSLTGTEASAAWLFAACLVACVLLVLLGPDPERSLEAEASAPAGSSRDA